MTKFDKNNYDAMQLGAAVKGLLHDKMRISVQMSMNSLNGCVEQLRRVVCRNQTRVHS